MRHENITPGSLVRLKPARSVAYGLSGVWEVSFLQPRKGYKVPYVAVKSNRPEGGVLFFTPSDLISA